jgi:tagatose-1,6-bisphosphate aldolase
MSYGRYFVSVVLLIEYVMRIVKDREFVNEDWRMMIRQKPFGMVFTYRGRPAEFFKVISVLRIRIGVFVSILKMMNFYRWSMRALLEYERPKY